MDSIRDLENKIVNYSQLYYTGQDTISDREFDELVDQLRSIDPNNILLSTVGWGASVPEDRKVPHPLINVGGLGKIKCEESDYISFNAITPKYDGASVELIYTNGKLSCAITRGNGEYGQNVTDHLIPIVGYEFYLGRLGNDYYFEEFLRNSTISISGEFILSKESFKKNYPDEISHRNIPSGFLNRKEVTPEECKKFDFIPYRINAFIPNAEYDVEQIKNYLSDRVAIQVLLNKLFDVKVPFLATPNGDMIKYVDCMDRFTSHHDYNFDGLVINRNSNASVRIEQDGSKVIFNYDEVAYKTVTETADVIIKNISWNLTRTGRFVPVAEFDEVELSGAMIHRATCHNAKNMFDNGIDVGATIRITRSGEVIPFILEVLNPVEARTIYRCPECGKPLVLDGADLICENPDCKAKEYQRVYQWMTYLGAVDGAGWSLFNSMIEYGHIDHIRDLYYKEIDWSGMIGVEGMGQSKLDLVYKIIRKLHQPMKFNWILVASNIKGVSSSNAKKLCDETNLLDCLYNDTPELFSVDNAKGLGWSIRESIIENWKILQENIKLVIIEESEPEEIIDNSNKLKICVTGKLDCGTRSQFFELYKDCAVETDIKNCDYLVTNNPNSGSSKNRTAIELGKKVITEQEFCNLINN